MSTDYLPSSDPKRIAWVRQLIFWLSRMREDFRLSEAQLAELSALNAEFEEKVRAYHTAKITLRAASAGRRETLRALIQAVRGVVRQIDHHPKMDNTTRKVLGLNQKGLVHPKLDISYERPLLSLQAINGRVILHFGKNIRKKTRNGKPLGIRGVNVYRRKAGEENFELRGFATRSPYQDEVTGPAADWQYYVQYVGSNMVGGKSDVQVVAARGAMAA